MFDGIEETGIDRFIVAQVVHGAFSRPFALPSQLVKFVSRRVEGVRLGGRARVYIARERSEGCSEPQSGY